MTDLAALRKQLASRDQTDSLVALVSEAVRIPSVSGHEREVGAYFATALARRGIETTVQEVEGDSVNVVGRLKGAKPGPRLLFQGHMDTVPAYGHAEAFSGVVRDGKIFGRGACDMKGPLAAVVEAIGLVKSLAIPLRGEVVVACTADEESQKKGIVRLLESGLKADMAVSVEPTNMRIALAQKGCASLRLSTFGEAGHGSRPEGKANAIRRMATVVAALDGMEPATCELPGIGRIATTNNVGVISGGRMFMVVPDRCDIWIDHRMLPGETQSDALRRFEAFADALSAREGFAVEVALERQDWSWPPLVARGLKGTRIPPDAPVVRLLAAAAREVLGEAPPFCIQDAWCETDFLVNDAGIPTVNFGPGRMEIAHSDHEHIAIADMRDAVAVYALLILMALGDDA
ncbi:MAG TPA: ArgE/DapE family deacylase [Xanthobacteraceae bacterium]|nr:ArgE/DapE family deacylase [Xanthobacteraceae bacterium]